MLGLHTQTTTALYSRVCVCVCVCVRVDRCPFYSPTPPSAPVPGQLYESPNLILCTMPQPTWLVLVFLFSLALGSPSDPALRSGSSRQLAQVSLEGSGPRQLCSGSLPVRCGSYCQNYPCGGGGSSSSGGSSSGSSGNGALIGGIIGGVVLFCCGCLGYLGMKSEEKEKREERERQAALQRNREMGNVAVLNNPLQPSPVYSSSPSTFSNFAPYKLPGDSPTRNCTDMNGQRLQVGSRIEARWKGGSSWYKGRVTVIHVPLSLASDGDVRYDLLYDDDDSEQMVPSSLIRGVVE